MPIAIGQVLQYRYFVARVLGRGSVGAVYQATDQRLNVQCVVKETLSFDAYALDQFQREAQLLASLEHPHLPRVTDHFEEGGSYYLVAEYVDGPNGEEWVQRWGPISEQQAVLWGDQLLDALIYLHEHKPPFVHRDIKPANVRITSKDSIMLVDWGIAKEYIPGTGLAEVRAASPGFTPPEQNVAQGCTDTRTDIYAVGATLHYLLTGLAPPESVHAATSAPTTPVEHMTPRAGARVGAVLERAMRLAPEQRWQSAEEMRRALQDAAAPGTVEQIVSKPLGSAPGSEPSHKGRVTWFWIIIGIVIALALIGLLGLLALGLSGVFGG